MYIYMSEGHRKYILTANVRQLKKAAKEADKNYFQQ